jgi:hypothetical protein
MRRQRADAAIGKHVAALHRGYGRWPSLAFGRPPAMGDPRWTADLILATWAEAQTGATPNGVQAARGRSGGGFDVLDFAYLPRDRWLDAEPDLTIALNRRGEGRTIDIPIPWYGAGMSFGLISEQVMLARAKAAQRSPRPGRAATSMRCTRTETG